MTKKLLVLILISLITFVVSGCDLTSATTTTTTTTTLEETTTTGTTTGTTTTGTTTSATTGTTVTPLTESIPEECQSIAIVDGWVPVWCDEFEESIPETIIDTTKWGYHSMNGYTDSGNRELQYYTYKDPDNIAIVDGKLVITARREDFGTNDYTSAKIWTRNKQTWTYGKFEMYAKLPGGRGTWTAFWMMPQDSVYGGWPDSGEIDIVENVGYDANVALGTLHTDRFNGANGRGGNTSILISEGTLPSINLVNEFHKYGAIWEEGKIEFYFDDLLYGTVEYDPPTNNSLESTVDWPFNQPFYLILNLAVGGAWGGAQGVDEAAFPQTFTIDYVRVYQRDYVTGDNENPSAPSRTSVLYHSGTNAYLVWQPSTDDLHVREYHVYVNGIEYVRRVGTRVIPISVPGVLLKNLTIGIDNFIMIVAEDYAGNLSDVFETIITA